VNTWIALFRGINVLGNNTLPMKELKALLEQQQCADVHTYIQSGNAVFRSRLTDAARLERRLADAVANARGFEPRVMALKQRELARSAAGNPFPQAGDDPARVHLFFLEAAPTRPDTTGLDAIRTVSERYSLKGRVLYLYTPDGFGPSKLAKRAERLLGVAATARNWRTVTALMEMAKTVEEARGRRQEASGRRQEARGKSTGGML
jgi:uncharacterized protein (DUF1697 family)